MTLPGYEIVVAFINCITMVKMISSFKSGLILDSLTGTGSPALITGKPASECAWNVCRVLLRCLFKQAAPRVCVLALCPRRL